MRLKIGTTQNQTAFEGEILKIEIPTEAGSKIITVQDIPNIIKLIPGIVSFIDNKGGTRNMSISKGIALIAPNTIAITVSTLTTSPLKKITELRNNQYLLEIKLQKLKNTGNIEDITTLIQQLEKVKADIKLVEKL